MRVIDLPYEQINDFFYNKKQTDRNWHSGQTWEALHIGLDLVQVFFAEVLHGVPHGVGLEHWHPVVVGCFKSWKGHLLTLFDFFDLSFSFTNFIQKVSNWHNTEVWNSRPEILLVLLCSRPAKSHKVPNSIGEFGPKVERIPILSKGGDLELVILQLFKVKMANFGG